MVCFLCHWALTLKCAGLDATTSWSKPVTPHSGLVRLIFHQRTHGFSSLFENTAKYDQQDARVEQNGGECGNDVAGQRTLARFWRCSGLFMSVREILPSLRASLRSLLWNFIPALFAHFSKFHSLFISLALSSDSWFAMVISSIPEADVSWGVHQTLNVLLVALSLSLSSCSSSYGHVALLSPCQCRS